MKITINPKEVNLFIEKNSPTNVSFTSRGICFNKAAEKVLSLKIGSRFIIEYDDLKFYIKDSLNDGFEVLSANNKHSLVVNQAKINLYMGQFFKDKLMRYDFSIGEIKNGRRELILISKSEKKKKE